MFEASEVMTALNRILTLNNCQMNDLINDIKTPPGVEIRDLVCQLSMVMARSEAMEILTEELSGYQIVGGPAFEDCDEEEYEPEIDLAAAEGDAPPKPAFLANVEDDDPRREDPEVKAAREANSQRFFG